ncbi:MAG: PAS domain S-box protein [Planctomycetota bacterium]
MTHSDESAGSSKPHREGDLVRINERLRAEIAERRRVEEELRLSRLQYEMIVEDQTEMILRMDRHGIITFANQAYCRRHGITAEEAIGRNAFDVVHPDDRDTVLALADRTTREEPIAKHLFRVIRPDGGVDWAEWIGRSLFDEDQNFCGFQGVGRIVTDLVEARERLREKEELLAQVSRTSTLGEMVAGISHEVNQPLATIANFASAIETMLTRPDLDSAALDKVKSWARRIIDQSCEVRDVIARLKRFGEPDGERQSVSLNEVIKDSIELARPNTRTSVTKVNVECPDDLPDVFVNPLQIEQVLVNLLVNAAEALADSPGDQHALRVAAEREGPMVRISVIDNGPGLRPGDIPFLFNRFVSTREKSIGMGLAICRTIIENHGGKIDGEATEGGSRFWFTIPVAMESP